MGVLGGVARGSLTWRPEMQESSIDDFLGGLFVVAPTPVAGLSIRAEGSFARRGGDVTLDVEGERVAGGVRADYLAFSVRGQLTAVLGPVRLHVAAGPTVDQLLSHALDPVLAQVLDVQKPVVLGAGLGAGVALRLTGGLTLGAEMRLDHKLTSAFEGAFMRAHSRSREVVAGVSLPLSLLRTAG